VANNNNFVKFHLCLAGAEYSKIVQFINSTNSILDSNTISEAIIFSSQNISNVISNSSIQLVQSVHSLGLIERLAEKENQINNNIGTK
jgi:hypothetical protein